MDYITAVEILKELSRYEHTEHYDDNEIRSAISMAIQAIEHCAKLENLFLQLILGGNEKGN